MSNNFKNKIMYCLVTACMLGMVTSYGAEMPVYSNVNTQEVVNKTEVNEEQLVIGLVVKKYNAIQGKDKNTYSTKKYGDVLMTFDGKDDKGLYKVTIHPANYPLSVLDTLYVDLKSGKITNEYDELNNQKENKPDSPQKVMNLYINKVKVNASFNKATKKTGNEYTIKSIDLDGNSKKDSLKVSIPKNGSESSNIVISINGKVFSKKATFPSQVRFGENIYIVDTNKKDKYKEVLVMEKGGSGDVVVSLFRFEKNKIKELKDVKDLNDTIKQAEALGD